MVYLCPSVENQCSDTSILISKKHGFRSCSASHCKSDGVWNLQDMGPRMTTVNALVWSWPVNGLNPNCLETGHTDISMYSYSVQLVALKFGLNKSVTANEIIYTINHWNVNFKQAPVY